MGGARKSRGQRISHRSFPGLCFLCFLLLKELFPSMHDDELSELLSRARLAQQRLDTERAELAFETRMQSVISGTAQAPGPVSRFQTWLRATIGLAAATGIVAFLFLVGRGTIEVEDTLTAWWTDNAALWDLQLFN
jgi:hypothetical protein